MTVQETVALVLPYDNADTLVGDPEEVVLVQGGANITKAEYWLVTCTIQALKRGDKLQSLLLRYLEQQSEYDRPETPNERCARNVWRFDDGSSTCFPGLV
jgi:hypothetical protein